MGQLTSCCKPAKTDFDSLFDYSTEAQSSFKEEIHPHTDSVGEVGVDGKKERGRKEDTSKKKKRFWRWTSSQRRDGKKYLKTGSDQGSEEDRWTGDAEEASSSDDQISQHKVIVTVEIHDCPKVLPIGHPETDDIVLPTPIHSDFDWSSDVLPATVCSESDWSADIHPSVIPVQSEHDRRSIPVQSAHDRRADIFPIPVSSASVCNSDVDPTPVCSAPDWSVRNIPSPTSSSSDSSSDVFPASVHSESVFSASVHSGSDWDPDVFPASVDSWSDWNRNVFPASVDSWSDWDPDVFPASVDSWSDWNRNVFPASVDSWSDWDPDVFPASVDSWFDWDPDVFPASVDSGSDWNRDVFPASVDSGSDQSINLLQTPARTASDWSVDCLQTPVSTTEDPVSLENDRKVATRIKDQITVINSQSYKIGNLLGKGTFGAVYEASRLEDGLKVAIKFVIKTENMVYISTPGHPKPLPIEVALLILANEGPRVSEIINLIDWQDRPNDYIMVLEPPSPCEDLFGIAESSGGSIDEDQACVIMRQTTHAAFICCQRGVLHGDIKLKNLLFNQETRKVKLIDFGCGDLLVNSPYNLFIGTDEYCPPKNTVEGAFHGEPATVWTLGVLLFALVCGDYPTNTDLDAINANLWFKSGLSKECCHLIGCLLQRIPEQRIKLEWILSHDWFTVKDEKCVKSNAQVKRKRPEFQSTPSHLLSWLSQA